MTPSDGTQFIDTRFTQKKSGYGGHVPMFRRSAVPAGEDRTGQEKHVRRELKELYTRSYQGSSSGSLPRSAGSAGATGMKVPAVPQGGKLGSVEQWSLRAMPSDRQEYPAPQLSKPTALRKIVGYGGHRQGAAFITGETFTQEQLIVEKHNHRGKVPLMTYEPDKSADKGKIHKFADAPACDATPWTKGVDCSRMDARIPGTLLRSARQMGEDAKNTATSPHIRRKQFPAYPIMRGPTRFRVGGHDVFLVN